MKNDDSSGGWAKVVGPCYTTAGIAETLGWTDREVAQGVEELRLLAVGISDDVLLFPAFQLHDGRVVDGMQEVLQILRTGTASRWVWAQFLNVGLYGGAAQIRNLREGRLEDVLRDAQREAAAWQS